MGGSVAAAIQAVNHKAVEKPVEKPVETFTEKEQREITRILAHGPDICCGRTARSCATHLAPSCSTCC
jgi:hypothetical protein